MVRRTILVSYEREMGVLTLSFMTIYHVIACQDVSRVNHVLSLIDSHNLELFPSKLPIETVARPTILRLAMRPCAQKCGINTCPPSPWFQFSFFHTYLVGIAQAQEFGNLLLLPALHIAVKGQDELPSGTSLAEFLFFDLLVEILFIDDFVCGWGVEEEVSLALCTLMESECRFVGQIGAFAIWFNCFQLCAHSKAFERDTTRRYATHEIYGRLLHRNHHSSRVQWSS
jgi:hypothetical protein